MKIGMGLPDLVLCPECEKAVKQEKGRFCKGCSHKVREYQEKHNLVIDFWMRGAQGENRVMDAEKQEIRDEFMVTHMHVKNKDGTTKEEIEIVDVKNKRSLGVFKVINDSQHIITNPVDDPEIEAIYKERFDIAK